MMLMNQYTLNLKLRVLSHCPIVSGMSHLGHRGTLAALQRSRAIRLDAPTLRDRDAETLLCYDA